MRIILVGKNHAEILKLSAKQENQGFAKIRGGAYQIYPDSFARLEIYDKDGKLIETDELIVIPENRLVPYNPLPNSEWFGIELIATRAEEHKNSLGPFEKPYITFTKNVLKYLWKWWPMLLAGVLIIYAFVSSI